MCEFCNSKILSSDGYFYCASGRHAGDCFRRIAKDGEFLFTTDLYIANSYREYTSIGGAHQSYDLILIPPNCSRDMWKSKDKGGTEWAVFSYDSYHIVNVANYSVIKNTGKVNLILVPV